MIQKKLILKIIFSIIIFFIPYFRDERMFFILIFLILFYGYFLTSFYLLKCEYS